MEFDYETYELVRRRAAYPLLRKFGINRYELWMLCQMCGYIRHQGRTIVGKQRFFSFVTGNSREKSKMMGYYIGLSKKGFIALFEYVKKPGSESFGISALGVQVLTEYECQVNIMVAMVTHGNRLESRPTDWLDVEPIGAYYPKVA